MLKCHKNKMKIITCQIFKMALLNLELLININDNKSSNVAAAAIKT